jgi:hypothetical protein
MLDDVGMGNDPTNSTAGDMQVSRAITGEISLSHLRFPLQAPIGFNRDRPLDTHICPPGVISIGDRQDLKASTLILAISLVADACCSAPQLPMPEDNCPVPGLLAHKMKQVEVALPC